MMRAALILALSLCACGVPSAECTSAAPNRCGATAAAPTDPPDAATESAFTLLLGDSHAEYWATTGAGHWPAATTVNRGVAGTQACAYSHPVVDGWYRPGEIYIMLGTNDIVSYGKSAAQTWACFQAVLAQIEMEFPRARIILEPTLLRGNGAATCATDNPKLIALQDAIYAQSDYQVADTWPALACTEACGEVLCDAFTDDDKHLNAAGYAARAAALGLP